uniref:non-specific serine/threonine protein kinase n=1 Tax=Myxobolus squamalis TaxID=59785 RepID=A0A6B2G3R6_MYXSQ
MNWSENLIFPLDVPIQDDAKDMICRFLTGEDNRIGKDGVDEIKNHIFLRNTNWENLRNEPPAIPVVVKSIDDTSNFNDFPDVDVSWITLQNAPEVSEKDWVFLNYTFKRFETVKRHQRL